MTDLNIDEYALTEPGPTMVRTAQVSGCGAYRYSLTRAWAAGSWVTWVMLNPSTADGTVDDPTIRRCIAFSKAWGFGGLTVVNLFALRSTDPKALLTHADPCGPHNLQYVKGAVGGSTLAVAAWGAHKLPQERVRIEEVAEWFNVPLVCLGTTKNGSPRHPLYVRADQERLPWPSHSKESHAPGN